MINYKGKLMATLFAWIFIVFFGLAVVAAIVGLILFTIKETNRRKTTTDYAMNEQVDGWQSYRLKDSK